MFLPVRIPQRRGARTPLHVPHMAHDPVPALLNRRERQTARRARREQDFHRPLPRDADRGPFPPRRAPADAKRYRFAVPDETLLVRLSIRSPVVNKGKPHGTLL
jgi:hypothetical protein